MLVGEDKAVEGFDNKGLLSPTNIGAVCGRQRPLIEPCSGEVIMADNSDT